MFIYFLTFYLFFLASIANISHSNKNVHTSLQKILFTILVYQMGFRWEVGTDWLPYLYNYDATTSFEDALANTSVGFELGYGLLAWLSHYLSDNYTFFLVLHATLFYSIVFSINNRISPFPTVSLLLFYSATIGVLGSNRQLIALAICLYSLQSVFEAKPYKFFSLVIIATTFHTSALIFSIFYWLNRDIKKIYWLALIMTAIAIGNSAAPSIVFEYLANSFGGSSEFKANHYLENSITTINSLTIAGLAKRILIFMIALIIYKSIVINYPKYKLFFNGYCIGLIIYFLYAKSLLILVNRGSLYFNIMEVFILTFALTLLKSPVERYIAFTALLVYSAISFHQGISGYFDLFVPYQSIFTETDFKRALY